MEIRLARESEIAACTSISNWAVLHTAANFATEPEEPAHWVDKWARERDYHPWYVAIDAPGGSGEERVLGFAKSSPFRERCAYRWTVETTIYVDPGHHGRGIGRELYQSLLATLRNQGYHVAIAGITTPNPGSEALHARCGFHRVCLLREVGWKFGRWHDVGYWHLALQVQGAEPREIRKVIEADDA